MSVASFKVKYRRPEKLSDPHGDFTRDLLQAILDTPDSQMGVRQYINLFGPHLPAGTYKESIYFLPQAFRYLLLHERDAFELVTAIIGFVSINTKFLAEDGILETVRDCMRECFSYWVREFQVIHFDKKACRQKGWGIEYDDAVVNSELIAIGTTDLVRFHYNADLAEEFVRGLAFNTDDPVKAAWFLEYSRSQHAVYHPPVYEPITNLINDDELLLKAMLLVEQQIVPNEPSPTYWRDTFKIIGSA